MSSDMEWDIEVDVVVVGSGMAGCAAAVTAASKGLSVVILERDEEPGERHQQSPGGELEREVEPDDHPAQRRQDVIAGPQRSRGNDHGLRRDPGGTLIGRGSQLRFGHWAAHARARGRGPARSSVRAAA